MKKTPIFSLLLATCLVVLPVCVFAASPQSLYNSGTDLAQVVFAPGDAVGVTAIAADTATNDTIDVYTQIRTFDLSAAASSGATSVSLDNSSSYLGANDVVVIVYQDGTLQANTVSSASATAVTLGTALSQAATTDATLREMQSVGSLVVSSNGTVQTGAPLFAAPALSPLLLRITNAGASWISATGVRY